MLVKHHLSAGYTGSKLKRVLETDVQESGLKIKVVEKVGTNIKRMVQWSNPFKRKCCSNEDCLEDCNED